METNEQKKQYIAISFTLKGQEFADIRPILEKIAAAHPGAILISGFMSREDLSAKGITDTTVPDVLNELFPDQRNFYKDGDVRRRDMFTFAYDNLAQVYVIGRIKDGVKEEVVQYLNAGMDVIFLRLDGAGETGPVKMTHEEANSFLGLNESLVSFGNYLLSAARYNNIREAHPEWDEVEVERHSNEVTHADIENWLAHPNKAILLNNKTSNDMKTTSFQRNTDTDQNGGGAGTQQEGQGDQNLSQGNEGGGAKEDAGAGTDEGKGSDAGNDQQAGGEQTTGGDQQTAGEQTEQGSGSQEGAGAGGSDQQS